VVIDANHVPTVADLVINIVDDAPRAIGDTDHVSASDPSTDGNVIDGTGTTSGVVDVAGADGGLHVVGIAFGGTVGTVGVALPGANGTLTIDAQGNYTYTRTGSGTAPDVFTYRVADTDGTESTSQLTIAVDNAAPGGFTFPTAATPGVTEVFEAGLPASRGVGARMRATWMGRLRRRRPVRSLLHPSTGSARSSCSMMPRTPTTPLFRSTAVINHRSSLIRLGFTRCWSPTRS
jgi:hypothetical protein